MSGEKDEYPKVYLAGPDVFLAQAREVGHYKKALCEAFKLDGLFPLDQDEDAKSDPNTIFEANCALMREADIGIFNLTPFRGPSADCGTAFELGHMFSSGKRVFGYTSNTQQYRHRVDALIGNVRKGDRYWAKDQFSVEDFGLVDNLMLDRSIFRNEGVIITSAEDVPNDADEAYRSLRSRMSDAEWDLAALPAFRRCLEQIKKVVGG